MNALTNLLNAAGTKGKGTSLGVMGPTLGAAVLIANTLWGLYVGDPSQQLVTDGDVEKLTEAGSGIVNAIGVVGITLSGIYGRIRAQTNLRTGQPLETRAV